MPTNLNFLKGVRVMSRVPVAATINFLKQHYIHRVFFTLLAIATVGVSVGWGQTIVTYTLNNTGYYTKFASGGDIFTGSPASSGELGMWANTDSKQIVAWRTYKTAGDNSGSNRALQVGDVFKITVYCTRAFGQIGFSLNAGGTQGTSYANNISGSRLYVNTDNYGSWYVNRSGGNTSFSYNPSQNTYRDYIFTVKITSSTTADVFLTVDGTDYRAYNLTMNGTNNIDAFSVYGSDMWDGNSNDNAYWKQTCTVQNSGSVELGYYLTTGTYTPGLISNGLAANSTSTSSTNVVNIGGDAGTAVILNQNNTYTGPTTINNNATLRLGAAGSGSNTPLGTTDAGTTVSSGGSLDLNGFTLATAEALTLNGTGQSSNGALRNGSSTGATYSGLVTLGSASSIIGGSGTIALSNTGTITGSGFGLTLGGVQGGSIASIIGTGAGTLTKQDAGTWTLSNANTYTGATSITGGTLTLSGSGTLGSGSDVRISSGATLNLNGVNATVGSVAETGVNNGGTITLGSGTLTVNGANKGTFYQNSISGTGGITMAGSGTTVLSLYGTQSYTGTTTVSGGKIASGVAFSSKNYSISGGALDLNAINIVPDDATISLSGGTVNFNANETIQDLIATSGTINIADGITLSINGKLSLASGVTVNLISSDSKIIYGAGASLEITTAVTTSDAMWPSTNGPNNVIINASGSTVTLHANRTISGTLTLTAGKISTGSYTLYISNTSPSAISGYDANDYIIGNLKRAVTGNQTYVFPIGTATDYQEASVSFSTGYSSATDLTASFNTGSFTLPSGLSVTGTSIIGVLPNYWRISSSGSGSISYSVTLNMTNFTSQGNSNKYTVLKKSEGSSAWGIDAGSTHTNNNSPISGGVLTVQRSGLTSFSDFSIGYGGYPLPVTFTSISGTIHNGQAKITWNVAQEIDVDRYEVEESSDGRSFRTLTNMSAAGRSSYQANDGQVWSGANFYRVKAVDIDGKLTYSKIIRLDNGSSDQNVQLYPNPTRGEINLALNGLSANTYRLQVVNALGQAVYQQSLTHDGGNRSLPLNLNNLPAGIYQVQLSGGTKTLTRKLKIEQ